MITIERPDGTVVRPGQVPAPNPGPRPEKEPTPMPAPGPARVTNLHARLRRVAAILCRLHEAAGHWTPELGDTLALAEEHAVRAVGILVNLPEGFIPPKRPPKRWAPAVGDEVVIKAKFADRYVGLLTGVLHVAALPPGGTHVLVNPEVGPGGYVPLKHLQAA